MASIFGNKDRLVIPGWRSFKKTLALGELGEIRMPPKLSQQKPISLEEYIKAWKNSETIAHAGDLLSAAFVNNQVSDPEVIRAAQYSLKKSPESPSPQRSLADHILKNFQPHTGFKKIETAQLENFQSMVKPELIRSLIHNAKRLISKFPYNPIFYVELARYYSILGQGEKAMHAMRVALNLGSTNRFILRSASRLFAHEDQLEFVHDVIRKSPLVLSDPWVTSTEIALAMLRGRTSKYIKKGVELLESKNYDPFSTAELASSLGTVELLNGTLKKSRNFFKSSLQKPNDNSLAQVNWALSVEKSINLDTSNINVQNQYEAQAMESFSRNDFHESLENAFKWFLDMPFARRPVMLAAHISGSILDDQKTCQAFLRTGLISHPNNPQLINNLAYSLLLENQHEEALRLIETITNESEIGNETLICLTATRGLVAYKKGLPDLGRTYYLEAIEKSKALQNYYYNWLAVLNFAREELHVKSEHVDKIMESVEQIPENTAHADVNKLKSEVLELHAKAKQVSKI